MRQKRFFGFCENSSPFLKRSKLKNVDWCFLLLILGFAVAVFGFLTIIGQAVFGVSWFSLGVEFVLLGLAVLGFSLLLLVVQGVLEKLKHKSLLLCCQG